MRTADFDYPLPDDLIAQKPSPERDRSRLLALDRATNHITHHERFGELTNYFRAGDVLVLNDSRVFPARLRGRKEDSGGEIEVLLLSEMSRNDWWALLRPGKRVRPGTRLGFSKESAKETLAATVVEKNEEGHCRLRFLGNENIRNLLQQFGEIPLPPYIARHVEEEDRERYQTVFARSPGSVAAPTAGLHFTDKLLLQIEQKDVVVCKLTLHVGLGTFAPVKTDRIESHGMHEEEFVLSDETALAINTARGFGRRIFAVGTTTVRVLESVAAINEGRLIGMRGRTQIFIRPPFAFRVVDHLLTNFHLPRSTLLMLVSAFAAPGETRGRELILGAYAEAVRERYRFFSYGDAMLIL
jgi:S-adenosylmethionine:tRNA ribosyltransferase-isomerase